MKTRKSTAFWAVYAFLGATVALLAWRAPETMAGVLPAILTALVASAGTYQGANVLDNWQRGRNFRSELHNPEEEK